MKSLIALAALALFALGASAQCPPPLLQAPPPLVAPASCTVQAAPVAQGVAFFPQPAVTQFPTFAPQTASGWPQAAQTCSGANCGQTVQVRRGWGFRGR